MVDVWKGALAPLRMIAAIIVFSPLMGGCANKGSMNVVLRSKEKGQGTAVSYSSRPEEMWPAIDAVLNWSAVGRIEDHRSAGFLLVWIEPRVGRVIGYAGVWVEPDGDVRTRVTVVSRPEYLNGFDPIPEDRFHRDLLTAQDLIRHGKPLPLIRPE